MRRQVHYFAHSIIITVEGEIYLHLIHPFRYLTPFYFLRIASIDFKPPYVLSGSSDKHLRLFDMISLQGWSTCPDYEAQLHAVPGRNVTIVESGGVCKLCGSDDVHLLPTTKQPPPQLHRGQYQHEDLVRSVALGDDWVLSGSYDLSIKVRARPSGFSSLNLIGLLLGVGLGPQDRRFGR